ncbi:MAG: esterase [Marmoricola sp.]|nr:esterase [Marmoricola sp.]
MGRSLRLWLICQSLARTERRFGPTPIEARRAAEPSLPDPLAAGDDDGLEVTEHVVPVDGGSISVWVYRASGAEAQPAHLLLPGGAFCYGGLQDVDAIARRYAVAAQCAVLAVGYRLAPEHPWPTAQEDTHAALVWAVGHADELGIDVRRVSIGGISAGGCVAAATALLARDRGGPALIFQLLEIPITDLTLSSRSADRFGKGYLLSRAHLEEAYAAYVPDRSQRRSASPLFAADLSGLPPTMVLTAEYDPLRDEGEAYAARLREAGVRVQTIRAKGHVHSSTYSTMKSAIRYQEATAAALAAAYTNALVGQDAASASALHWSGQDRRGDASPSRFDAMSDVITTDNPGESRFEAHLDGKLAGRAWYTREGNTITFTHTVVETEFEGHGVGASLARTALDQARAEGLTVVPQCPFISSWIAKHPDYADLVKVDQ